MNKWKELSNEEKKKLVDEIVEKEIRPMIISHGGNVNILDVKGNEIFISYQGACAGCAAAFTSTLSFIENVLKERLSEEIFVTPVS